MLARQIVPDPVRERWGVEMDLNEAQRNALEARRKMLDARPKDSVPPLPDSVTPSQATCVMYFQTAAFLYAMAQQAYAAGDVNVGLTYEFYAFQHNSLGQACLASTGALDDRGPS
jgi:hypothetical protein